MTEVNYERQAQVFHALGSATRLEIAHELARSGDEGRANSELARDLGFNQQLVTYHLGELRRAGLVTRKREGLFTVYRINEEVWAACGASMAKHYEK